MKREISLPFPKSSLVEGPLLEVKPGQILIRYDFEPLQGSIRWITITFKRVIAFKYMTEACCISPLAIITGGMVEFDLDDSPWLKQVQDRWDQYFAKPSKMHDLYGKSDFRHFGVWFDHEGCYEVIAEDVSVEVESQTPMH